jgi:hypothetical protein
LDIGEPAGEEEGGPEHAEVDHHRHSGGSGQAEGGNQEEPAEDHPAYRAEGVDSVEDPRPVSQPLPVPQEQFSQDGEGASHEGGGNEEEEESAGKADQVEGEGSGLQGAVEEHEDVVHAQEQEGEQDGPDRDASLEESVDADGVSPAVDEPAEPGAAQGEPGHVGGEHGGHRVGRGTEDVGQAPGPDDLIDEGAHSGGEEQAEDGQFETAEAGRAGGLDSLGLHGERLRGHKKRPPGARQGCESYQETKGPGKRGGRARNGVMLS